MAEAITGPLLEQSIEQGETRAKRDAVLRTFIYKTMMRKLAAIEHVCPISCYPRLYLPYFVQLLLNTAQRI